MGIKYSDLIGNKEVDELKKEHYPKAKKVVMKETDKMIWANRIKPETVKRLSLAQQIRKEAPLLEAFKIVFCFLPFAIIQVIVINHWSKGLYWEPLALLLPLALVFGIVVLKEVRK